MSIKRYSPRSVRDCDGDWFSTGNEEKPDGRYVLHSDYANILTRHTALVEAVAWMRECDKGEVMVAMTAGLPRLYVLHGEAYTDSVQDEFTAIWTAACAEVDRLIAEGAK